MTIPSWLDDLCSTAFMPHGQCYLWDANLLRLHGISDGLIALAYFSIPLALLYFVRKRRDLPYPAVFLLFGAFIVACGTTHLMEVVTIWHPYYWLSGSIKAFTAGISLVTAVALVRILPDALALPSPGELRELNLALEEKVRIRTADLSRANEELRLEVSQRQAAEQEVTRLNTTLQQRFAEMQTLVELLPVGVGIAADTTGRNISSNRALARMLGLSLGANASLTAPAGEAPTNFRVFAAGRELAAEDLPIQRALRENQPVINLEETIERTDGTALTVLANAVPLQDAAGRCRGCVATFQDITPLVEMERNRREVERKLQATRKLESLGVLAGGIAHDFNNLLTGILGNASLARAELPRTSSLRPILEQIEHASHRAADLCRQMLAYSGRGRFLVEPIDLNELIRDTTRLLSVSIGKNCTLRLNLAPNLPAVDADAAQLRQVIMNLAANASEAIGERTGAITIATGVTAGDEAHQATLFAEDEAGPGRHVFIEVSDDGCGMSAATREKIFDPFFTTKFTGRGLGLAAVLGIVRGHKGAVQVDSEPGRGTTFRVLLPGGAREVAPAGPAAAADKAPWRGQGTVLVVDDEDAVREVATLMLRSLGFACETAPDGQAAVEKYRREPARYALVLLDLTMPYLDGEETFHQLRHLNPAVKIVLMSGFNQQEAVSRFTGQGLAGFVQKPFEIATLLATVRRVFRED